MRGAECLRRADVVVYDRLANPTLLAYASPRAELIDAGKEADRHALPQEAINALLIERARAGKVVARLKGGDPFVFGRGGEEALALAQAGLPFEIVPGVTSAIAEPAYAGIPVTQRGVAGSVAIIAGHRADEAADAGQAWQALAAADTLVFLMGVANLPRIVAALLAAGRPADTPVAAIANGTLPGQQIITGTLSDIVAKAHAGRLAPPAVIVIGEVVRLHAQLAWFDRSPADAAG